MVATRRGTRVEPQEEMEGDGGEQVEYGRCDMDRRVIGAPWHTHFYSAVGSG